MHACMHAYTPTIYTYMHLPHSPQVLLLWCLLMERFCVCHYAVYSSHRFLTACKFAIALRLGATFVVHIKMHKKCKRNKLISHVLLISFDL
jgi:hypothetical protein